MIIISLHVLNDNLDLFKMDSFQTKKIWKNNWQINK